MLNKYLYSWLSDWNSFILFLKLVSLCHVLTWHKWYLETHPKSWEKEYIKSLGFRFWSMQSLKADCPDLRFTYPCWFCDLGWVTEIPCLLAGKAEKIISPMFTDIAEIEFWNTCQCSEKCGTEQALSKY